AWCLTCEVVTAGAWWVVANAFAPTATPIPTASATTRATRPRGRRGMGAAGRAATGSEDIGPSSPIVLRGRPTGLLPIRCDPEPLGLLDRASLLWWTVSSRDMRRA